MYLLPIPQKITEKDVKFVPAKTALVTDDTDINKFASALDLGGDYKITFTAKNNEKAEYYTINCTEGGMNVTYSDLEGAYRAYTTVMQVLAQAKDGEIPEFELEDYPSISRRGYMLDISRGKLPTLDHLKEMVDLLASLKYNELQLYVDAIVVEYKNFPKYTAETETLSQAEIKELSDYCAERFIHLVPNQNTFGHMAAWTQKEEFAPLAITGADGKPSQTLDPQKNESIEFVKNLLDGYVELFDTDRVNIGMDETVDLGLNETKEICDKLGVGRVYTDYLSKICSIVTEKYKKAPMFWDDIIFKHPEELDNIPKNAIVMQWGYETEHHYDRNCRRISERGLRFYVCPGTSMWGSYIGRSNNALLNITTAAECGAYYGAEGFLLTEWGDEGHPQFPSTAYCPVLVAAGAAWNAMSHDSEIAYEQREVLLNTVKTYLDRVLYHAEDGFADVVYRMGNYYLLENDLHFNGTLLYHLVRNPQFIEEKHKPIFRNIRSYMKSLRDRLSEMKADPEVKRAIIVDCDIVMLACTLVSDGKREENNAEIDRIIAEFSDLWLKDNHKTGLEIFTGFLEKNKA